jgi:hypothetical protein
MIALLPALMFGEKLVMDSAPPPFLSELGIQFALTVGLWGVFILGVVIGVSEGLLHKKVFPGVVAAPLLVILFWGTTAVGCSSMFLVAPPTMALGLFGSRLVRSVLPYLLSLLFFRLACLWA